MAAEKKSLSLIIPDLLHGLTVQSGHNEYRDQLQQQKALGRLLDRAETKQLELSGFEYTLLQVMAGENSPLSLAWLTRLGEQNALPLHGAWLRVDPVHMRADLDNVVMFGTQVLAIQQHEADALIAELNATYADLDWLFEAPVPQRWYLHMPASPRIRCNALTDVIGQNLRDRLPTGEDSLFWQRTINEIQMLLYQSPVNLARREAGAEEINSVWVWGNGAMDVQQPSSWPQLWGDDVLLRGFGVACGRKTTPLPEKASDWFNNMLPGNQLILLSGLQQGSGPDRARVLQQYEQYWFAPLLAMLRNRQLDVIEIFPCNGTVYRVTRSMLLRFWRHSDWQRSLDQP